MRRPKVVRVGIASGIVLAGAVIAVIVVAGIAAEPTHAREVRASLGRIVQDLDRPVDSQAAFSSNPYDYIEGNPNYEAIVALGFEALPALEAELDGTDASGLREYIVCVAIEDITNCDLKQYPEYAWDRASAFKGRWDVYLKDMPGRVTAIVGSDRPVGEKVAEIQRLGAPAVPFVLDSELAQDQAAHGELVRAVSAAFGESPAAASPLGFGQQHADRVKMMRGYVEAH